MRLEKYVKYVSYCFREKYFDDCSSLRDHVLRHNVTDEENAQSIDCMKIAFENEYLFIWWNILRRLIFILKCLQSV